MLGKLSIEGIEKVMVLINIKKLRNIAESVMASGNSVSA